MIDIRKSYNGKLRGMECWDTNKRRVVDAASNRFLDFLQVKVKDYRDLPETLRLMVLERWHD